MRNPKFHLLLWTIISLSLLAQSGFAQGIKENVNYFNYSIENGLPSSETYDILQDSRGFIWIGTDNGVVRFDGVNFKTFTTQDGLTDNTVFKIYEDYQGRIWFGTYNRKLCMYSSGKISAYAYNDKINEELIQLPFANTITEFSVSKDEEVYMDLTHRNTRTTPPLVIDKNGQATRPVIKGGSLPFKEIQFSNNLKELIQECIIYVNTHPRPWDRIIHTQKFEAIRVHKIDSLLYVGTRHGLYICSLNSQKLIKHVLPNYYITSISTDFEGGIWCSSLYNGVFYIPSPSISSFSLNADSRSQINAIVPYANSFLFCFNKRTGNFQFRDSQRELERLSENVKFKDISICELQPDFKMENTLYVHEIYADINGILRLSESNYLLTSSSYGLMHLTIENTPNPILPTNYNKTIGPLGNTFFNTTKEHCYLDDKNNIFKIRMLDSSVPRVFRILQIDKTRALLGTINGVFTIDLKTFTISKAHYLGLQDETRIQDIVQLKTGQLLFATKGKGIIGYQNGKKFNINITHKEKVNTINQIINDTLHNKIYTATNYGVYEITHNNNQWDYHSIISSLDGPKLSDIRQIRVHKDQLLLANNNGVSILPISSIKSQTIPPKLYINSITLQGQEVKLKNKITLPYDSNFFDITYQAIGFKSQNNYSYFYRLSSSSPWRTTKNSVLTFNSLDPGLYQFEIKAANAYGVESAIEKLDFEILTPYWLTWWFISLLILVIVTIIGLVIYQIISFYKNQTAIQRKLNELQVLSLQSKMSPHFIFNSLNSIQNYILTNNKMAANEYLIEFSRLIRTILKNSEESTILLSKELKILNLYVELEKKRLRKPFTYNVEIKGNINLQNCVIPSLLIQPYVENAIWHGQVYNNPNGEIKISIVHSNNSLFISISDNGIGMRNSMKLKKKNTTDHTSIGTKNTKNRIELISELNAQMSKVVISDTNPSNQNPEFTGTTIQFSIPYIVNSVKK